MQTTMRAMTLAAAIVAAAAGVAEAADIGTRSQPYVPAPVSYYNWGGLYAGLNVGYEWAHVTSSSINPSGVFGGGQVGYNWQNGQFVFGAETDIQASAADDTFAPWKFSNPWFGTLRGRAGVALNNVMFYGTGGLAYGGLTGQKNGLDESKTLVGWTGGVGMEVGFNQKWSAKAEYLYMDLGDRAYSITGMSNNFDSNLLRLGVNYRF